MSPVSDRSRRRKRAYGRWFRMVDRCTNPNNDHWHRYGGRGIYVCDEWLDFQTYYDDTGDAPDGMTLDRIDNNGPYRPTNVRWASPAQQRANIEYDPQASKTACPNGHPYDDQNTQTDRRSWRTCKTCKRAKRKARRLAQAERDQRAARHGTTSGYRDDGCRCERCKKAIALEHNVYKIRREVNGGPLMIDKLGAVRRLHALMALGWPRRELARIAGYQGDAFALVLSPARTHLRRDTFLRIVELYDDLRHEAGPSNPSRIAAAKKGWPTPDRWYDIDDPDEQPDRGYVDRSDHARCMSDEHDAAVVDRILAGDFTLARGATESERVEVVARWPGSLAELERAASWNVNRYRTEVA